MTRNSGSAVLIYQVGKVGSSSIAVTLSRLPEITAYQVHRLNPDNIARVRMEHERHGWRWPPGDKGGLKLYESLIRPRIPVRVVTLVREPIARNISSYFHNLDKLWNTANAHASLPLETLVHGFPIEFPFSDNPLHWFDYEFREMLGVDVYQHPFDHSAGVQKITGETCEILILRSDLSDSRKAKALGDFLGIALTISQSANVAAEKPYAAAYKAFLRKIRMLPEYVDLMLGSKFSRHFFEPAKLQLLRKHYLRGGHTVPDAFVRRWDSART